MKAKLSSRTALLAAITGSVLLFLAALATTTLLAWEHLSPPQVDFQPPVLTPTPAILQDVVNDVGQVLPLPDSVGTIPEVTQVSGFTIITVTLEVRDAKGLPVQNALVKAFSEDWGVRYPADWGAFYTTDHMGRVKCCIPAGEWTFFASGGDAYRWNRPGQGLFTLLHTTVDTSSTLILQPDSTLNVALRDVDGKVLEADEVYLMESSHVLRVPFPVTGRTQGGQISLHVSSGIEYDLLLLKRPDSTPGYFLYYTRCSAGGMLYLQPTRNDLALVHLRAHDRFNRPATLNATLCVAWLDMDRMHGFFDFNVTGQADLYITPQWIRLNYRNLSTPDWYYLFVGKYYDLQPGLEITYSMGGPISAGVRVLGKQTETQLWLPVWDAFDNQMDFFSGPGGVCNIPITLTHHGHTIYTGTLTGLGGYLPQGYISTDSPQYQINLDLGPPYGRFNLSGTLLSPQTAYGWEINTSSHFTLHTPFGFTTQAAALSAELESAYAHLSNYLGEELAGKINVYIEPWPTSAGWGGTNVMQAWLGGFRWHHPQWPAGIFESVVWHELGHVFQFTPPLLHGVDCPWFCEPWATYLGYEAIEALQGERLARWHRSNHVAFFKHLDGGEANEVECMQFILFYLRNKYGTEIHRDFVHLWADPNAPGFRRQLANAGFTTREAVITLYSCLADQNLAWLFRAGGFAITDARVEQGFHLTGCRVRSQPYKIFLPAIIRNYQPHEPLLLNLHTDPADDWIAPMPRPASMDIRQISLWLTDASCLRFETRVNESIPATPSGGRFYGWFLDTDQNASTGQHYNDIGSDFNVQVSYFPESGWHGFVINTHTGIWDEHSSFVIDGESISLLIPLSAIGEPKVFNWIAIDQDDVPYYADIAPNIGHIHTEITAQ